MSASKPITEQSGFRKVRPGPTCADDDDDRLWRNIRPLCVHSALMIIVASNLLTVFIDGSICAVMSDHLTVLMYVLNFATFQGTSIISGNRQYKNSFITIRDSTAITYAT